MKLLLVRNAESLWNKENRLQGHQDSPLTEEGKQQSKQLAELLRTERIDVAYASDLGRSIDTAKAILTHHPGIVLQRRSELRERSHGIVQGMTQKEAFKEYPALQKERFKNKFEFKNPKGESYADALERVKPFWNELLEKHKNHIVLLVSHAGINRLLLGLSTGISPQQLLEIDQPHESVYVVENAAENAVVKRWSKEGIESGALKRVQLKKMPKIEEDEDEIGLDDD